MGSLAHMLYKAEIELRTHEPELESLAFLLPLHVSLFSPTGPHALVGPWHRELIPLPALGPKGQNRGVLPVPAPCVQREAVIKLA